MAAGSGSVPGRLAAAACVASVLPDVDSLGFGLGIPYDSPLGHRGFTHSLFFALLIGLACAALAGYLRAPAGIVFAVVFSSTASHGLLDALTTGGLGVAFLLTGNKLPDPGAIFPGELIFVPLQIDQIPVAFN